MKRLQNIKPMTAVFLAVWILSLHVNAILKSEDPIRDTQTEGISYDQKMEQEKDGVKAPATPKIIYYGGQGFLTRSSLAKSGTEISSRTVKPKEKFNWSDWWEDRGTATAETKSETDTAAAAGSAAPASEPVEANQNFGTPPEPSESTAEVARPQSAAGEQSHETLAAEESQATLGEKVEPMKKQSDDQVEAKPTEPGAKAKADDWW